MSSHQSRFPILVAGPFGGKANALHNILKGTEFEVLPAESITTTTKIIEESNEIAIAILDQQLTPGGCYECLAVLREKFPACQSIVVSQTRGVYEALEATKRGAFWLITEPYDTEQLLFLLAKACVMYELTRDNYSLRSAFTPPAPTATILGGSPRITQLIDQAERVAQIEASVLITGESGTGKTTLARLIHQKSPRAATPFIAISCASIPRDLLESELFGHEKGAFTGATAPRAGSIELANGGTLFLDEIGDMPLELQPKLLTFLQDRTIKRVGGNKPRTVDVRIITATNRDLPLMCREKQFREDLFFRINVLTLHIPPLRERVGDIKQIALHIIESIARKRGTAPLRLTPEAIAALENHPWSGNVRELENILERASVFASGRSLKAEDITESLSRNGDTRPSATGAPVAQNLAGWTLHDLERQAVLDTLAHCKGNKVEAARSLGISLKTIYNKMKSYKIDID